jgi:nucleoside-diphosphate-sugar epimerase
MLPFGSIYNVGTGRQTTLRDIVELTRRIFDISSEPQWSTMEGRSWDTNIWVANNSKLRATGWKPEYEFEDGYSQTIAWFRNNPRLVEKIYHQP